MQLKFTTSSPLWRSLRHRNYRLYITGQLVSVCGTWMQQVALSWLVYRLTNSATLLGVVGFASQIPILGLGPIGGVISDRYSCHRVAVWTQCAALVQAVLLASLTLMGWIQPLHIILLGAALGVVYAFDMPARQALVHELVDTEDLANAVALNSSMINAARIVGPALAGLVVAKFGEGVCFVINAVSYIATIAALLMMKLAERPQRETAPISIGRSLIEGYRYTLATTPIRDLLILLGVVGVMGMPYMTLDARVCSSCASQRRRYAGIDVRRRRLGRAHRRAVSRPTQKHYRPGPGHRFRRLGIRRGTHLVYRCAAVLAFAIAACRRRLRLDGADRGEQYGAANPGRRRHARPGDEPFLDDAGRHGAVRQFAGRLGRRSSGRSVWWWRSAVAFALVAGIVFARQLPRLREAAKPILAARGIVLESDVK